MAIRKQLSIAALTLTALLLLVATLTSVLRPAASRLPPRADLLFHLAAHALLCALAMQLVPTSVPPEAVFVVSVAAAVLIEVAQASPLVVDRSGDAGDVAAAALGSLTAFATPRDGASHTLVRPSWGRLVAFVGPAQSVPLDADDEDEDDGDAHRVNSWAV